jgi:hypothetical protein
MFLTVSIVESVVGSVPGNPVLALDWDWRLPRAWLKPTAVVFRLKTSLEETLIRVTLGAQNSGLPY